MLPFQMTPYMVPTVTSCVCLLGLGITQALKEKVKKYKVRSQNNEQQAAQLQNQVLALQEANDKLKKLFTVSNPGSAWQHTHALTCKWEAQDQQHSSRRCTSSSS
jgi:hypothetical protein